MKRVGAFETRIYDKILPNIAETEHVCCSLVLVQTPARGNLKPFHLLSHDVTSQVGESESGIADSMHELSLSYNYIANLCYKIRIFDNESGFPNLLHHDG